MYRLPGNSAAVLVLLLCSCLFTSAACTRQQYARQADRSAYSTVASAQGLALGAEHPFDITYSPLVASTNPADKRLGSIKIGQRTIDLDAEQTQALSLDECLEIAVRNSRSFQTKKETLYSSALALANARRGWSFPLLGGGLSGEATDTFVSKEGGTYSAAAGAGLSLTQNLVHGGVITLASTLSIASDFLGGTNTTIGSLLEANVTQPLLRGAWRGFAYETQYRLERNFVFSVFEYERFTQRFAVDILTRYYSVLRQRDQFENDRINVRSLKETVKLTQMKVDGGEVSQIQLDQTEQDLLNSQVRLERSQQSYRNSLDEFKITLGLSIGANVEAEYPGALEKLARIGPKPVPFDEARAIDVAFTTRPDVLTERAKVRDAGRDVEIAADSFNPRLDVTLGISAPSAAPRAFEKVQFHRNTRSGKVIFDYQLDQTDNRDAYRNSMIALEKARRDYDVFTDNVRLEIRKSYRTLGESSRSYELQVRNVAIAVRRVKLARVELREGFAIARDVLEAQESLRSARNGLTRALVNYTTTRFAFLADSGMLWVDERGQLHERTEPFRFNRIRQRYDRDGDR